MTYDKGWKWSLVFAVLFAVIGGLTSPGVTGAPIRSGTCQANNVQAEANRLAAEHKPKARQFDPATGTEYLRYRKQIVKVEPTGPQNCSVRVENLDHFHDGTYIFLGPGFSPSSPSRSSGGSSGSSGGVK